MLPRRIVPSRDVFHTMSWPGDGRAVHDSTRELSPCLEYAYTSDDSIVFQWKDGIYDCVDFHHVLSEVHSGPREPARVLGGNGECLGVMSLPLPAFRPRPWRVPRQRQRLGLPWNKILLICWVSMGLRRRVPTG